MFRNYFKTAWRNLWKNKFFSGINIIGLAIGMGVCIVIMLFVFYEKSFDNFHQKNIYRLDEVQKFEGMVAPQNVALSMYPMGPTLKNEFPEILNFTRIRSVEKIELTYNDKKIVIPKILWADSTFFQIFNFRLLRGATQVVLEKPGSVVLTQEIAKTIFGGVDPIGKTLVNYGRDTTIFTVTGILDQVPANSHLQFDGLFSFNTYSRPESMNNWGSNWLVTYLELSRNLDITQLEKKFPAYVKVSKIVGSLATLAIIISCLGLLGLASFSAERRIKEVGIRKVLGATVENIVLLLSKDFIKLVLIANVIAWPLAWFALNSWLQDFAYRINISWWVFAVAGLVAIAIALLTVSFQAIRAAFANPVNSLRTE